MGNVRVEMNLAGIKEVLNDDGVIAECMKRARRINAAANAEAPEHGYFKRQPFAVEEGTTSKGNRCAVVYTRTELGKRMQAKHSTLTHAINSGRG